MKLLIIFSAILLWACDNKSNTLSIITLGDSYTYCQGVKKDSCWTDLLVQRLNKANIMAKLAANPAVSGYTTEDLIQFELPVFLRTKPDITILMIGTNDIFRGYPLKETMKNYRGILDVLQGSGKDQSKIYLLTIPDFTITPEAKKWDLDTGTLGKIIDLNSFIKTEAEKRKLSVVDIFDISKTMSDPEMVSSDGLHPSSKQYSLWEKEIFSTLKKELPE